MKKGILLVFFMLSLSALGYGQSALTNDDVISMVNSGLSPAIIAAKIHAGETNFDTSAEGLKKLGEAKVPETVIVAMIDCEAEQRQTVKQEAKASDLIPEQGNLADIKGRTKVYILTSDAKSRDKIIKELDKKKLFDVVDSIEKSDFVIKFESWEETRGALAHRDEQLDTEKEKPTVTTTATVTALNVRIGVLTVFMPSATTSRIRLLYSAKETQRSLLFDHPAESTTKDFLKAYTKVNH